MIILLRYVSIFNRRNQVTQMLTQSDAERMCMYYGGGLFGVGVWWSLYKTCLSRSMKLVVFDF